jgi:hypothetical protein
LHAQLPLVHIVDNVISPATWWTIIVTIQFYVLLTDVRQTATYPGPATGSSSGRLRRHLRFTEELGTELKREGRENLLIQ